MVLNSCRKLRMSCFQYCIEQYIQSPLVVHRTITILDCYGLVAVANSPQTGIEKLYRRGENLGQQDFLYVLKE